jgi:hypothetical protein
MRILRSVSSMRSNFEVDDPDMVLRSNPVTLVEASLPDELPPPSGESTVNFRGTGEPVNGVATWLCLELAAGHILQAEPGRTPRGFYAKPFFTAFPKLLDVSSAGQEYAVRCNWDDQYLGISLIRPDRDGASPSETVSK